MNLIIKFFNKQIKETCDIIFEIEKIIEREEFRKEAGKSHIYNIDALRNVKKTYEHNYNKLLDAKYSFLEMHMAEDIENERRVIE